MYIFLKCGFVIYLLIKDLLYFLGGTTLLSEPLGGSKMLFFLLIAENPICLVFICSFKECLFFKELVVYFKYIVCCVNYVWMQLSLTSLGVGNDGEITS